MPGSVTGSVSLISLDSVTSYGPSAPISMTPCTEFNNKSWTPDISFCDNRHEDFEEKVKEKRNEKVFYQNFHLVPCDIEVIQNHKCQDFLSLYSPFNFANLSYQ